MLKEIIPSKFKIVDGNCSGDSQSFNGLVVLNDYLAMHPYSITHSADGYYRTYLPADDGKRKQIKKIEKRDVPNDR